MRRTIIFSAVIAALLACIGGAPFSGGGPMRGSSPAGVASPRYVTRTMLIKTAQQNASRHTAWRACDSTVNLTGSQLVWDQVNHADSNDSYAGNTSSDSWRNQQIQTKSYGQTPNDTSAASNRSVTMFWIPFEDLLPVGVQIDSAILCIKPNSLFIPNSNDSLYVVLDTLSNDRYWHEYVLTHKNGHSWADTNYSGVASFKYQVQGFGAEGADSTFLKDRFYPRPSSHPWVPNLYNRTRTIDWGPKSVGKASIGTVDSTSSVVIDITRSVQRIMSGEPNHGLWLQYRSVIAAGTNVMGFFHFNAVGTSNALIPYRPFIYVKYRDKSYSSPWPNGAEVAVSFNCEDTYDSTIVKYLAALPSGVKMTIAVVDSERAIGDPFPQFADYVAYRNAGHEIASHSRLHRVATGGLRSYDTTTLLGNQRLWYDMDPTWLYTGMGAVSGSAATWAADPLVGKMLVLPGNQYNLSVIRMAAQMDYYSCRGGGLGSGGATPTVADSIMIFGYGINRPQNAMLTSIFVAIDSIAGPPTGHKKTEAEVRRKVQGLFERAASISRYAYEGVSGSGHRYAHMAFYAHGERSEAIATTDLIDPDQLGWMMDEFQKCGAWIAPLGEVRKRIRFGGFGYAVDHPDFGTNAAWEDTFKAATNVWRKFFLP